MGGPVTQAVPAQGLAPGHSGRSFLDDPGTGAWQRGVGTHSVTVPPKPGNGPAHLEPTVSFSNVQGRAVCLWRGEARPE